MYFFHNRKLHLLVLFCWRRDWTIHISFIVVCIFVLCCSSISPISVNNAFQRIEYLWYCVLAHFVRFVLILCILCNVWTGGQCKVNLWSIEQQWLDLCETCLFEFKSNSVILEENKKGHQDKYNIAKQRIYKLIKTFPLLCSDSFSRTVFLWGFFSNDFKI